MAAFVNPCCPMPWWKRLFRLKHTNNYNKENDPLVHQIREMRQIVRTGNFMEDMLTDSRKKGR